MFRQGWTPSAQHGPRGLREGAVWGEMDMNISLMILSLQHPFFLLILETSARLLHFWGSIFCLWCLMPLGGECGICANPVLLGRRGWGLSPPTTEVTLWPVLTQKRGPVSTGGAAGSWECRWWGCHVTHLNFSADVKSTSRSRLQLLSEELGWLSSH